MQEKKTFRLTLDLPIMDHKRLKALAAVEGKSMRDIIVEALNDYYSEAKLKGKGQTEGEIMEMAENIMDKYDVVFRKLSKS